MPFKKVVKQSDSDPVGALLEVLPGHTESQVVDWLRERGATEIKSLAPGFLSVVATPDTLQAAEAMARVGIKRRKALRSGE